VKGNQFALWEPALLNKKISDLPTPNASDFKFPVVDEVGNVSFVDENCASNLAESETVLADIFQKRYQPIPPPRWRNSHRVPARLEATLEDLWMSLAMVKNQPLRYCAETGWVRTNLTIFRRAAWRCPESAIEKSESFIRRLLRTYRLLRFFSSIWILIL